jgi:CHASE2 domain-containing sensor protein
MIAPHLSLRSHWIKADNQPPQDSPRFVVVLIVILALVNVSATMLMFGGWATMISSMAELEQSITNHMTEPSH